MTSSKQTDAESAPADEATTLGVEEQKQKRRRRRVFRIGIQSKLLMTLLICSILSVAVVGLIGALSGRTALRQVEAERLTELRESQKRQLLALFKEVTNSLIVYSGGFSIVDAERAFTGGFDQLGNAPITPAQEQALVNYYDNDMIKPITRITGETIALNAVLPASPAQKYLQAYYTAAPRPADSMPPADAGDGSAWSAANARFDFYMRGIVTRFEYRDALLLDTRGNVVYSVQKGPDLGTNILTGPYRETNLREAYQKALRSNDLDFVWITDFQPYQPTTDVPTAWVVSPVGMNGKAEGVMALPLPISKINRIMTANKQWEAAGMGPSTESYLVGPDGLMRSDSRLFLQDPQQYRREAIAAGTPPDVVERALRLGTTTLVQPAPTAGSRDAQRGQSGTLTATDYTGSSEMEAYTPLNVPDSDLHWSLLVTSRRLRCFCAAGQIQPNPGGRCRDDDLRGVCGVDAACSGDVAAGPPAAGRYAEDQFRRLPIQHPGAIPRRNR